MGAQFDWSGKLQTADGRYAFLLPSDGVCKKRRVIIRRDGKRFAELKDAKDATTWHYNEDDTIDADDGTFRLKAVS
jgi:hypothetical protein